MRIRLVRATNAERERGAKRAAQSAETAARKHTARAEPTPPLLKALERIAEGKPRPVRLAPEPKAPTAPAERDLDAHDEVILTLCGRRIERHAGRFLRGTIAPETGEVGQVEQRTCESTYTLWEPAAADARYARTQVVAGVRWGAAHTLAYQPAGASDCWAHHVAAVEWEFLQWRRATTVIRGVCPELAALDGIGGQVLEVRGEMFLSGTVRLRYEHARSARRQAHG